MARRMWAAGLELAVLIGLLVQSALATALLRFWYHPQVPKPPGLPRVWFEAAAIGLLVALSGLAALRKAGTEAGTPKG
ncbi:MAG TPA: hypothetical protein VKL22_00920 [Actinomycetota bacterium]|nr:hypothetical protein [Actinomycetota bacterium]